MPVKLLIGAALTWMSSVAVANPAPGQIDLVLAQPFALTQPYTYTFAQPARPISLGTIIVVDVHPTDARVRQVGDSVLYVGEVPAERTNNGDKDGRIIAFVPGHVDLSAEPIFWGPDTLPERVDASAGAAARDEANQAPAMTIPMAPPLQVEDGAALYRRIADLIDEHAPGERERARGYRVR